MLSGCDPMTHSGPSMAPGGELPTGGGAWKEAHGCVATRYGQFMEGEGDSRATVAQLQPRGHEMKGPCRATSVAGRRGKVGHNAISVFGGQMKVFGRCGMIGAEGWGCTDWESELAG